MSTTIDSANVICKAKNVIIVGVNTPLQCNFNNNIIAFTIHINNVRVNWFLIAGHVGDIFANTTFIAIDISAKFFTTAIAILDFYTSIEIGKLFEATSENIVLKFGLGCKNLSIRLETHLRTAPCFLTLARN